MAIKKIVYATLVLIAALIVSFKIDDQAGSTIFSDPVPGNETVNRPLKICVISDLNSSYGSTTYSPDVTAVIKELPIIKPDIILCAGDMVAGQKSSLTEQNINDMWAGFKNTVLDPVEQLNIPFGFTFGNHDASPSVTKDRRLAEKFWKDNIKSTHLTFADSSNYPFYYSYIKNNVFFISWDAAGAKISPDVYDWMKKQLTGKTAKHARLRILIGHLPLYAIVKVKNKPGEVNSAPDSALTFFKKNGIDVYISGHQHSYYPARKEDIRFLNVGCIGDDPRPLIGITGSGKKSYTIIEVPLRSPKQFTQKAYMPVSNSLIDIKTLPVSVTGFNGISKREDTQ